MRWVPLVVAPIPAPGCPGGIETPPADGRAATPDSSVPGAHVVQVQAI